VCLFSPQARNILLKSSGGAEGRPFVAKVADFGLSMRIDPNATHVSNVYQVRGHVGACVATTTGQPALQVMEHIMRQALQQSAAMLCIELTTSCTESAQLSTPPSHTHTTVFDGDWTMFNTPSRTGEYQQLSVNTQTGTTLQVPLERRQERTDRSLLKTLHASSLEGGADAYLHPGHGTWLLLMADHV
jgi:hypothetical protein